MVIIPPPLCFRKLYLSASNVADFLWTLYLFTRDDMLTLIIPTV